MTTVLPAATPQAIFIVGRCRRAAKKAGWTTKQIDEFCRKVTATKGYNEAMQCVMEHFDVD